MWTEVDASCIDGIVRLYRGEGNYDDLAGIGGSLQNQGLGIFFTDASPYPNGGYRQVIDMSGNSESRSENGYLVSDNTTRLPLSDSSRTMMGWFKQSELRGRVFGYGCDLNRQAFFAYTWGDGVVGFQWNGASSLNNDGGIYPGTTIGTWYHVAYIVDKDAGTMSMYVDGLFKKMSNEVPNTGGTSIYIGGDISMIDYYYPFSGYVADFAIFDRVLSGDEIKAIYDDPGGLHFGDDDRGALCDNSEDYSLPEYKIAFPTCNGNNDTAATNLTVVITCQYVVTVPPEGSIKSQIFSAPNCNDDAPVGVAEPSVKLSDNQSNCCNCSSNTNYEVTIAVSPNDADNVSFCLKTRVEDDNGYDMIYRSQIIKIAYNYTAGFDLNITSSEYNGLSITAEEITADFPVEAFRCDSDNYLKDETSGALKIGDPLYVCIKSMTENIDVKQITEFTLKKDGVPYNAYKNGIMDRNTYFKGEGTDTVLVAHLAIAAMFTDDGIITIEGSALLEASGGRRNLARFAQEVADDAVTNSNFEVEVEVIKADSAANIAGDNMFSSLIGTVIGFAFMWNLYV